MRFLTFPNTNCRLVQSWKFRSSFFTWQLPSLIAKCDVNSMSFVVFYWFSSCVSPVSPVSLFRNLALVLIDNLRFLSVVLIVSIGLIILITSFFASSGVTWLPWVIKMSFLLFGDCDSCDCYLLYLVGISYHPV